MTPDHPSGHDAEMTCADACRAASTALNASLAPDRQDALDRHLRGCPECADFALDAAALRSALRDLPTPPEPPADVLVALSARLASPIASPTYMQPVAPTSLRWGPAVAGMLGVAAGVFLGLLLTRAPPSGADGAADPGDDALLALAFGGLGAEGGPRRGGGDE
jgi:anti-sigma factor RsiW